MPTIVPFEAPENPVLKRFSVATRTGVCHYPSHDSLASCPLHGCPQCCVGRFAGVDYEPVDITLPPVAPAPHPRRGKGSPRWLWTAYVRPSGCAICDEIYDRSLPEHEQAAHRDHFPEHHCEGCRRCLVGARICRECRRCEACSKGFCEEEESRWDGRRQRDRTVYYEEHDWFDITAVWTVSDALKGAG